MALVDEWWHGFYLTFFTHWSFWILFIYFASSTFLSIINYKQLIDEDEKVIIIAKSNDKSLIYILSSFAYCTSFSSALVVTILFWPIINPYLPPRGPLQEFLNVSQHACNLGFIFLDFTLNNMVFIWGHLVPFSIYAAVYLCFALILPIFYNRGPPYPFLDNTKIESKS
jgi:hypothetical protein